MCVYKGVAEMLDIESVNHVGIRVGNKSRSVSSNENLGFGLVQDAGFELGNPVIMKHPSGVVVNLIGPANVSDASNILMDVDEKYPGYTHCPDREFIGCRKRFHETERHGNYRLFQLQ